jgi:hypothetical protein
MHIASKPDDILQSFTFEPAEDCASPRPVFSPPAICVDLKSFLQHPVLQTAERHLNTRVAETHGVFEQLNTANSGRPDDQHTRMYKLERPCERSTMAPCKNRQACHTPEHFLVMAAHRHKNIARPATLVQRIQSCLQGPRSPTDVSQTRVVHPYWSLKQIPWHDAACMPPAVVAAMDACTATHSCKGELRQARQQQYPALPTDRRSRRATVMSAALLRVCQFTCDRAVRRCRSRIYALQIHAVPCPGRGKPGL